jgi:ribosomal peptide maturation radical SAM protein 1
MDALAVPDFSDYFREWSESSASLASVPTVLVETSRGCWWGDKSHCTFCGLNGEAMAYRSKSGTRALQEMQHLSDRWQTDRIEVVDNILDMRYFSSLLPALAEDGRPWEIFFEVKANLSRQQVAQLRAAGVTRIQPGIESLSNHVLKLMRKGTCGLRNVQLLKWCLEYGIMVDWNILYGFPGETVEDYEAMLAMLPAIEFLQPPVACGPIRMDRFSPYYEKPEEFGLVNVRPIIPYRYLYPFPHESLMRIAYYFDFDYADGSVSGEHVGNVMHFVEEWRRKPDRGLLSSIRRRDGSLLLRDTRPGAASQEIPLFGADAAAYEYCDEFRSFPGIVRRLQELFPDAGITDAQVRGFLDSLVANRLMLTDGSSYLSLAVRAREIPVARQPLSAPAVLQLT